jgi:hypothetical protein
VDGYYKHFLPDHEATGRLMYDRRRVSYYGYAANDSINDALDALDEPEDARKQFYNDIGSLGACAVCTRIAPSSRTMWAWRSIATAT